MKLKLKVLGVTVVESSHNGKLSEDNSVTTTYVGQQSCSRSCPFYDEGCYALYGKCNMTFSRLTTQAKEAKLSANQLAQREAKIIDRLVPVFKAGKRKGKTRAIRLHTAGDCRTTKAARLVSAASRRYLKRGGGKVWTYTHAWRTVPRSAWKGVSVLASVENAADARKAKARGYVPAIVVEKFDGPKAFELDGQKFIPCPAQTSDRYCDTCRLCWDDSKLQEIGAGIAFEAHGPGKNKAKRKLNVVK